MIRSLRRSLSASFCVALLVGGIASDAFGQDGKLISAVSVTPRDDDVKGLEKGQPDIRAILNRVEIKSIAYLSDELKVRGYLVTPRTGERLPCVIYNRGGNRDFGAWSDVSAAGVLARIASWGYVVVASQYRGNAGGEGKEEFGGKDVNDVLNLLPLLKSVPQANADRIGMYGWSRGGMMTYLALARTDRIAAAVVASGLADLSDNAQRRSEMDKGVFAQLIPEYTKDRESTLAARSAVRWPEKLHKGTPILLLHGSADSRVHPGEARTMASKLSESRHSFRFVLFEGGDHGLSEHRGEVERLVKEWFDGYLRDRKAWPSLEPHDR